MTVGGAAAAHLTLIVWCSYCRQAPADCGDIGKDLGEGYERFLKGTVIRVEDSDRKIEDLAPAICCRPFSAG